MLLVAIALILCLLSNPATGIDVESVIIPRDSGQNLFARIYTPTGQPAPHGVMILCHGVNNSKQMMAPLAVEFARHGVAAIAFDFGGYGESYPLKVGEKSIENLDKNTLADARIILDYIRRQPKRFDRDRVGILGHSMGGTTALQLATQDPQLRSTIVLGMAGNVAPTSPANLFLGAGVYEQINPPEEVRETLREATGNPDPPCINNSTICGNFQEGTARKLVISGTADHMIAPFDPDLMRSLIRWTQQSLDLPEIEKPFVVHRFIIGSFLMFGGGIFFAVCVFLQPYEKPFPPMAHHLWRRCVAGLLGLLMTAIWGLGRTGQAPAIGAGNMLLFTAVLLSVGNYALSDPQRFSRRVRVGGLYGCVILAAVLLPTLLCGVREIAIAPRYLLQLPQFLLQWPIFVLYTCTQAIKVFLFPSHTLELRVSWLFLVGVWIELIWPGTVGVGVQNAMVLGVKKLRRPPVFRRFEGISGKQVGLLGLLLFLLAIVWSWRVADGLVAVVFDRGWLVARMFGQFLVLPIAFIIVVVRSKWFQKLEKWVARDLVGAFPTVTDRLDR